MKKLSIFFLIFLLTGSFSTKAQRVHFGVANESRTAELHSTDPVNEKKHYMGIPMTMPKGSGVIFFMQSNSFSPALYLFSPGNQKYFGKSWIKKENGTSTIKISFITPADTTFYLILTTANDNETGAFTYGYHLLDSTQMKFDDSYSACEKLIYLFNHWQVDWHLIPGKWDSYVDADEEIYYDYWSVSNSFAPRGDARVVDDNYEEVIYTKREMISIFDNDTMTGQKFYDQTCARIKACLDMNAWKTEPEEINPSSLGDSHSIITHFFPKDSAKNEKHKAFKIILKEGLIRPTEVLLVFN